ncbi:hypothetical protein WNY81_08695 [Shewanella frigidimarina]|uniref:hypothetical protein n=1 Tax=Shewanella frigidimarina TaxID=56812 RepID=UPI0031763259
MNVEEYVRKEIEENEFRVEGEFEKVIHYSWCEHNEMANVLEIAAPILLEELSKIYPNCQLEIKNYPAPNHEYNVQISVWS